MCIRDRFYTGKKIFVDTAGRVEKFNQKYKAKQAASQSPVKEEAPAAEAPKEEAPAAEATKEDDPTDDVTSDVGDWIKKDVDKNTFKGLSL